MGSRRSERGVTLVELLLTIAIVAVLAGLVLDSSSSGTPEQLRATAQVIAGELDYARALAIQNNSSYRITLDFTNDHLALTHQGANSLLNTLPSTPFQIQTQPSTQQIVALRELPGIAAPIDLLQPAQDVRARSYVEFGPTGATTSPDETHIWLASGLDSQSSSAQRLYVCIRVLAATGLVEVGDVTNVANTDPTENYATPLLGPSSPP